MYPSDKVWKNINASLHTRRRWFFAGMLALITGILFFAGKELIAPSNHPASISKTAIANDSGNSSIENDNPDNNISSAKKIGEMPISPAFAQFNSNGSSEKSNDKEINVAAHRDSLSGKIAATYTDDKANVTNFSDGITDDFTSALKYDFYSHKIDIAETDNNKLSSELKGKTPDSLDSKPENTSSESKELTLDKKANSILQNTAPYELITPKKLNRKYWQLYISPIVTYRTLSGAIFSGKSAVQNAPIANTSQNANPNLYANNKPAVGFEVGSSIIYRLTRNLSFKIGLQFNYSRYSINAYISNPQPTTIALNSVNAYSSNTITSYTNISTVGGKAAVNLQNQYFQIASPIGFELRILGNEKLQFNVGATIQPTYLLNRDSYLLTSDYTNYTQEPSLFKKWNINGGVEAFISYKTGKIRWQVGPQFRYQLFSTYTSEYPINENLKGFGIKFGITKTIW